MIDDWLPARGGIVQLTGTEAEQEEQWQAWAQAERLRAQKAWGAYLDEMENE